MDRTQQLENIQSGLSLPPGVQLRAWQEEDFPAIQQLSHAEGWITATERAQASLASWQCSWPALVAVHQGQVIGFLRAVSDGAVTTYVAEILVAPSWRRQGVGQSLLDACQKLCPETRLDLLAASASAGFYRRCGFRSFMGFRRSWEEALPS